MDDEARHDRDGGAARGRTARADVVRNRALLMTAAHRLIDGGAPLTLADVASQAGLTRATLYRHFADREALVRALVAERAPERVAVIAARLPQLPLADAMRRLGELVVEFVEAERPLLAAVVDDLETVVRDAVVGEPIEAELARRRAAGEFDSTMSDAWLAGATRALCLHGVRSLVTRDRTGASDPPEVAAWLGESLVRLIEGR